MNAFDISNGVMLDTIALDGVVARCATAVRYRQQKAHILSYLFATYYSHKLASSRPGEDNIMIKIKSGAKHYAKQDTYQVPVHRKESVDYNGTHHWHLAPLCMQRRTP
jgi:hypothetical protein